MGDSQFHEAQSCQEQEIPTPNPQFFIFVNICILLINVRFSLDMCILIPFHFPIGEICRCECH